MARKKGKEERTSAKGAKKRTLFQRIGRGVSDIRGELKRVVWPDKKKLKQSTATVLAIILMFMVLIYIVDVAIRGIFTTTGFYSAKEKAATETVEEPAETVEPVETAEDDLPSETTVAEEADNA